MFQSMMSRTLLDIMAFPRLGLLLAIQGGGFVLDPDPSHPPIPIHKEAPPNLVKTRRRLEGTLVLVLLGINA